MSPSSDSVHSKPARSKPVVSQHAAIDHLGLSLLIILVGSFIAPLLMHSSTLAIPAIAADLRLSAEQVSSFTLMQMLGSVIFVLPAGKLADKFGRRRLFCLGLFVASASSAIAGVAVTDWMMIGSRVLGGVGAALIFASAVALLMSVPPEEQKVKVMGIYISVAYLGIVLGPVFGGVVLEYLHWRWVFLVPSAVLFVLAVIGIKALRWERYGDRNTRLRFLDFFLYATSLSVLAVGVFDAGEPRGQLLLAMGLLFFGAFCWFQTKRRDPLLQVGLFTQNRTFLILGSSVFLLYLSVMALPFTLTLYFQYLRGIDAKTTGFILLIQALCTVCVSPAAGWLGKRFLPRYLIFAGVFLFLAACWLLASLSPDSPIFIVVVALMLMGTGFGLMDAPLMHTSMSSVSPQLIGSASATMNGLRTMGGFIGLSVISFLMGRHLGDTTIEPAVYPQLMTVLEQFFLMSALVASLTLVWLVYGVLTQNRQR